MDCSWHTTFLQAFFEPPAVSELPIWRIFKMDASTNKVQAISADGEWDAAWAEIMSLRELDTANQYDCRISIHYEQELPFSAISAGCRLSIPMTGLKQVRLSGASMAWLL